MKKVLAIIVAVIAVLLIVNGLIDTGCASYRKVTMTEAEKSDVEGVGAGTQPGMYVW